MLKNVNGYHDTVTECIVYTNIRALLHMAKNLPTNSRRILNEYSANSQRRKILRLRRILTPNFNFLFNFFCETHFFSYFLGLWTCFRKKIKLKLKILCRRILYEQKFFAGEEKFFVEYSSSIRRLFVGKLFAMCRWALTECIVYTNISGDFKQINVCLVVILVQILLMTIKSTTGNQMPKL